MYSALSSMRIASTSSCLMSCCDCAMACSVLPGLAQLDACEPDDLTPLLDVVGNELAELGRQAADGIQAQILVLRLDHGALDPGVDLPVQPVDDIRRRVFGRAEAAPGGDLEVRDGFADRRD